MYELSDFIPEPVPHDIKMKDFEINLMLRPFTNADEAFLKRNYGEKLEQIFRDLNMEEISKIFFKQLTIESKEKIMAIKFHDIDDNGNKIELYKTGHEKILELTASPAQQISLIESLIKTRGISLPQLEKIGLAKDDKKKA